MQTGWVHAMALHTRSGVDKSFQIHPMELLQFIGGQFGVISPLIAAGMLVAVVALAVTKHADLRVRFLLSQFLPLYGLFAFFSLNKAGQPNWAAPALIAGIILTVIYWREVVERIPAWRWGIGAAFGVAVLMTVVMHNTDPFLNAAKHVTDALHRRPIPDPLRRARGWADFAQHVQAAREQNNVNLLIADNYAQASMMAFYLPDQPTPYLLPATYGDTQFTLWPGYDNRPDTRALYVTTSTETTHKTLPAEFNQVKLVDDFWSQHHGRPVTHFYIYLCTHG
jgi:hypothetical protein